MEIRFFYALQFQLTKKADTCSIFMGAELNTIHAWGAGKTLNPAKKQPEAILFSVRAKNVSPLFWIHWFEKTCIKAFMCTKYP